MSGSRYVDALAVGNAVRHVLHLVRVQTQGQLFKYVAINSGRAPLVSSGKIVPHKGEPLSFAVNEKVLEPVGGSDNSSKDVIALDTPNDYIPESSLTTSSKVPASRFARFARYSGLAASLSINAMGQAIRKAVSFGSEQNHSGISNLFISDSNLQKIVKTLVKMRGAALKLGQMLSIQDSQILPPDVEKILEQVRNQAHFMPTFQLEQVMSDQLGPDWRKLFELFQDVPIAAASIGQVHYARVALSNNSIIPVAVKVQYPGVADSIVSDLDNLKSLLMISNFLPKGLFLDNLIRVAQIELAWETDYKREAHWQQIFFDRISQLNGQIKARNHSTRPLLFSVPFLLPHLSSSRVLTSEWMNGISLTEVSESGSQNLRNQIAESILELSLTEIFEFRFMQTDPNFANFLYDERNHRLVLLDFGATREFDPSFTNLYLKLIEAAIVGDTAAVRDHSVSLGFLTGNETSNMISAHVESVLIIAEPFRQSSSFDFSRQSITGNVLNHIPTMVRDRLSPPPDPSYALHRKLSGAFLLCTKLKSVVPCQSIFRTIVDRLKR